jgi:hypothetical protein
VPSTSSARRITSAKAEVGQVPTSCNQLLENYESDSSVEADEDTDPEDGGDTGTGPEESSVVSPGAGLGRRQRSSQSQRLLQRSLQ